MFWFHDLRNQHRQPLEIDRLTQSSESRRADRFVGMVHRFDELGHGIDAPLPNDFDQQRINSSLGFGETGDDFLVNILAGQISQHALADDTSSSSSSCAISRSGERQDASPTRPRAPIAASRTGFGPFSAPFSTADKTTVSRRSAMASMSSAARSGAATAISAASILSISLPETRGPCLGNLKQGLVGRFEMFDEQRDSVLLARENGAARRLEVRCRGTSALRTSS